MFNFYLLNQSYEGVGVEALQCNLQDLNDLVVCERKGEDSFFKHDSIFEVVTGSGCFADVVFSLIPDKQFAMTVLPKLFQSINTVDNQINTIEEFDECFRMYNGFYGVNFDDKQLYNISNKVEYELFHNKCLIDFTPKTFWERRGMLFSAISLCPSVENDIKIIDQKHICQIYERLLELDKYVSTHWNANQFSYTDANSKTSLRISPESDATMKIDKYHDQRMFKLPDGRTECFDLHIKTGDLRFHFFPENQVIYIGYIGKHLDTVKYH